jgi:F-type H+-transporting ATPase subunit gamma
MKSAADLLAVVKTMKVLAAVNIRQYQKAVESLAEYNRTIELGLHVAIKDRILPDDASSALPPARCAAVILGSDQGLCGPLNRQITAHALSHMESLGIAPGNRTVLAVGARVLDCCEAEAQPVAEHRAPPASEAGITPMVQEIILLFDDWHQRLGLDHFFLYYCRTPPGATYVPHGVQILPVDRKWLDEIVRREWRSRSLPVYTMDGERLFSSLIREYLFADVYRAFAESLASENASRLAAMRRAQANIEDCLEELRRNYYRSRQMVITEELLDIVSGFEALETRRTAADGATRYSRALESMSPGVLD